MTESAKKKGRHKSRIEDFRTIEECMERIGNLEFKLDLFYKLMNQIPQYVYTLDREGLFYYWNTATKKALGLPGFSGDCIDFLNHASRRSEAEALVESANRSMDLGVPTNRVAQKFQLNNGQDLILDCHDIPFTHPVSGGPRMLGLATDRTAEYQLNELRLQKARIEHELDIARSIQNNLLPTVCLERKGLVTHGWSKPSSETGGDFYDWFTDDDGTWYIVIGDATGHGIGPALVAATTKAYTRAILCRPGTLNQKLNHLSRYLIESLDSCMFVTFAVCAVNPKNPSKVQYISAGHGPCFNWADVRGQVEEMRSHGPPLGVIEGIEYEPPTDIEIETGGGVLLLTDGLSERSNENGDMLGTARIIEELRNKDIPLKSIISNLCNLTETHAGTKLQEDDMTLVGIQRLCPSWAEKVCN